MTLPLFHVDAFTDRPLSGNPAAVCLLPSWKEDRWLQAVGREMNLSETAFLVQNADGFDLRWFTPEAEVELCGHATLASAHVLWQQNLAASIDVIQFSTKSGLLKAVRMGDGIELDVPLEPDEPADPPANLLPALGVSPRYVGKNRFDYVVEVESEQVLRQVAPDFKLLRMIPCRDVIVTSRSADPQFDFASRAFYRAPRHEGDLRGVPHVAGEGVGHRDADAPGPGPHRQGPQEQSVQRGLETPARPGQPHRQDEGRHDAPGPHGGARRGPGRGCLARRAGRDAPGRGPGRHRHAVAGGRGGGPQPARSGR